MALDSMFSARVERNATKSAISPTVTASPSLRAYGQEQPVTEIDTEVTVRQRLHTSVRGGGHEVGSRPGAPIGKNIGSILVTEGGQKIVFSAGGDLFT